MRKPIQYPMGSISSCTMRPEDLIPTFLAELEWLSGKTCQSPVNLKTRREHRKLFHEIDKRMDKDGYFELDSTGELDNDLEALITALECYCAPYFYFGSHPGDGADYGFWLSEDWDEDFASLESYDSPGGYQFTQLKVNDLSEIPSKYRGEVAVVNDHGNVTLYVKTSRSLREIWSVV